MYVCVYIYIYIYIYTYIDVYIYIYIYIHTHLFLGVPGAGRRAILFLLGAPMIVVMIVTVIVTVMIVIVIVMIVKVIVIVIVMIAIDGFFTLSTLKFSRGLVRKDGNLRMEIRCTGLCEQITPPDKKTLGKTGFQSTK